MSKEPWSKFFWPDWRSDPCLRMCSYAARGLWMEMLTIMHEATPRGFLLVNGVSPTVRQLSVLCGGSIEETADLLAELEAAGVFSRNRANLIYCRRMAREELRRKDGAKAAQSGMIPGSRRWNQAVDNANGFQPPPGVVEQPPPQPPPHPIEEPISQKLEEEENPPLSGTPLAGGTANGAAQDALAEPPAEVPPGKPGALAAVATGSQGTTPDAAAEPKAARRRRLPEDWAPSDALIAWAAAEGITAVLDLAEATERFRDYWRGVGKPMADWGATWRNWMRRERKEIKPKTVIHLHEHKKFQQPKQTNKISY